MSVQAIFASINESAQPDIYDDNIEDLAELSEPDLVSPAELADQEAEVGEAPRAKVRSKYKPVILGKDADLLQFNTETNLIEPKEGSEIAVVGLKGELDAYLVVPGANFARQLSWDSERGRVQESLKGKSMGLAPGSGQPFDITNFSIVKPADSLDRIKRMTLLNNASNEYAPEHEARTRTKAEQDALDFLSGSEEDRTADEEQALRDANPDHIPPRAPTDNRRAELLSQFGPGGAVAMGLISGVIDGTMYAVDKTARLAGKLTSDGVKGAIRTCQEVVDQLKERSHRLNQVTHANQNKITDLNLRTGPSLADLDAEGELASAINRVVDRDEMSDRVSELESMDAHGQQWLGNLKDSFGKAFNSQLDIVHKAMNLDDISAPQSPEEFDAALAELPEEHQGAVHSALGTMKKNCEKLSEQLDDWLNDRKGSKYGTMPLEEQQKAAESIKEFVEDPSQLADPKYKDLIDHLGTEGKTFKEQISDAFGGLKSMLARIMTKLSTLLGAQELAREVHQEERQDSDVRMG